MTGERAHNPSHAATAGESIGEDRLEFILANQRHCDHFLSRIADPLNKSVLVVGAGAGTEMLWCLRKGAREVFGIDRLEQSPTALEEAVSRTGVPKDTVFEILQMDIEEAESLDRHFDLILSNNVFEHLRRVDRALQVCAQLVEPNQGRVAVFASPLYYSSTGSHLPTEPWEHLWEEPESLRERLLESSLPPGHALHRLSLEDFLNNEISLNRFRLSDYLDAARCSELALLNLGIIRDRNLDRLGEYLDRLAQCRRELGLSIGDFLLEGLYVELARPDGRASSEAPSFMSVEERRTQELEANFGRERAQRRQTELILEQERKERERLQDVERVLGSVEQSYSFRIGRAITAPVRWLRAILK